MCSSVETTGHHFVDDKGPRDTGPRYVAANGEVRQWQRCTGCGNVQTRLIEDAIPANEAAHSFVSRTGSDYIAANAYLPAAYDTCSKCDENAEHTHPRMPYVTNAEIDAAVVAYAEDAYCSDHDC